MIRPLLAAKAALSKIEYPVYASPKYDGIRCLLTPEGPRSRTGKPIPNEYIQRKLSEIPYQLDGEIMLFEGERPATFDKIQSAVMSRDGEPDFVYMAFDDFERPGFSYEARLFELSQLDLPDFVRVVPQLLCRSWSELEPIIQLNVQSGFEGTMIRSRVGHYKQGRSTVSEGILLKIKDFFDDEAEVIAVEELFHNDNPLERDAFGLAERSSRKENLIPAGKLGALVVSFHGKVLSIGTGFTEAERNHFWTFKPIGKKVTFRYQQLSPLGIPRFPSFLRIREDI